MTNHKLFYCRKRDKLTGKMVGSFHTTEEDSIHNHEDWFNTDGDYHDVEEIIKPFIYWAEIMFDLNDRSQRRAPQPYVIKEAFNRWLKRYKQDGGKKL